MTRGTRGIRRTCRTTARQPRCRSMV
jgi:hypothetical protein